MIYYIAFYPVYFYALECVIFLIWSYYLVSRRFGILEILIAVKNIKSIFHKLFKKIHNVCRKFSLLDWSDLQ